MSKELFVSSTPHETKLAIVEDDQLTEVYFERENEYTLAGSIYKGRVTRVLPGMQSAFVDIGLERDAFLYVTDFMEEQESDEEIEAQPLPQQRDRSQREERPERQERRSQPREERVSGTPIVFEGGADFEEDSASGAAPAGEGGEEFEKQGESEVEGESHAAQGDEAEGEGVRRWRGRRRRGRRRGGRGPEEEQATEQASASQEDDRAGDESEGPMPPSPAHPAPSSAPQYEPIILPGESIAKFNRPAGEPGESGVASEARHEASPEGREFRDRDRGRDRWGRGDRGGRYGENRGGRGGRYGDRGGNRFSDERRSSFSSDRGEESFGPPPGYEPILLPGESIAKYRGAAPSQSAEERQDSPATAANVEAGAAPAHRDSEDGTSAVSTSGAGRRYKDMNLASTFAGEEASDEAAPVPEEVETEFTAYGTAGQPETAKQNPAVPDFEHAEHGAPGGVVDEEASQTSEAPATEQPAIERHEFAPGAGHLEEEEIDEEEVEHAAPGEDLDDEEFEELEEEIMDRVADRAGEVAAGLQLTDAVEETEVERRAEEGYEGLETEGQRVDLEESEFGESDGELAESSYTESEAEEEGEPGPNGRAEVRAPAATAGYQQRSERPYFDRRRGGFQRGRRGGPGGRGRPMRRHEPRQLPQISELLKEGQEILVQIAKEPIAKKGARITSHIALPGRFLVYMPTVDHIGVSRKISSEEERQRLKRIVLSERENGHGGFIVRTAADRADEKELRADIQFLKNLWHEIRERAQKSKPPALIYHDLNLVERILRDQVNQNFATIWVDTEQEYERVLRFISRFQPSLVKRVKLYSKETPLFEQFNIQDEINKALKSKVWLKSGGYIVINQTEALVAIDVNTGKYVGKTARLEDTIVKTNVDAIKEIVRQVRLRDLGGIIVIDFIDMDERRNRQKVMQALEEALKQDRAPSKVLQFNDFGLVAITRKRVKQSLERTLGSPCPYCSQTGLVKSVTTVCNEIWVEMRKMSRHFEKADIMLRVNPEVAKALKLNNGRWIQELEELTGRNLIVKSDATLHQEQFDIT